MSRNGAVETAQGLGGDSASRGSLLCSCLCSYLQARDNQRYIEKNKTKQKKYINFYRIFLSPFPVQGITTSVVADFAAITLASVTARNKNPNEQKTPLKKSRKQKVYLLGKGGEEGEGLFCFFK